ncbi:hypothetical protein ACFQI3_03460 [Hansschlegelia quercus]|uniref:Uncharacterized protein n=1 Tax=Hansschlegelia quercus TaxID=2528245 RepID=A0A4Q9GKQ9_9HYPH|nr:hypothetical protein [Hansschlegelia quercus]TBN54959.1 hypothetical protein EYR15_02065 [Hansschlegelia quercus]
MAENGCKLSALKEGAVGDAIIGAPAIWQRAWQTARSEEPPRPSGWQISAPIAARAACAPSAEALSAADTMKT